MTPFAVGAFGADSLLAAAARLGRYKLNKTVCLSFVGDADRSRSNRYFQCHRFAPDADDYDHSDCFDAVVASVENAASNPLLELTLPTSAVCVPQDCVGGTHVLLAGLCRLVLSVSAVAAPADPSICARLDAVMW